jgi:hypothetical protein
MSPVQPTTAPSAFVGRGEAYEQLNTLEKFNTTEKINDLLSMITRAEPSRSGRTKTKLLRVDPRPTIAHHQALIRIVGELNDFAKQEGPKRRGGETVFIVTFD